MAVEFTEGADQIFRDYVTDGVPESGVHRPGKTEVRVWGTEVEDFIKAIGVIGELGTGIVIKTASGTYLVRELVAGAGILIADPDGVDDNPAVSIDKASAADYRAATEDKTLAADGVWDAAAGATLALVSATYTADFSLFASLATPAAAMGGNRTLGAPSNGKPGQHFIFKFTATGSTRTLTLHSDYKLWNGVEVGPYSVTTSQTLYVCGFVNDAGVYEVTNIGRRAT